MKADVGVGIQGHFRARFVNAQKRPGGVANALLAQGSPVLFGPSAVCA